MREAKPPLDPLAAYRAKRDFRKTPEPSGARSPRGGGSAMLWDKGIWEPVEGKSARDLNNGHLHFILHGERLKDEWLLVRLKPLSNFRLLPRSSPGRRRD